MIGALPPLPLRLHGVEMTTVPLRIMFLTFVPTVLTTASIQSERVVNQSLVCEVMTLKQY
jgi:hypothetical protein